MTKSHAAFSGSIPAVYDACLGPLLFEFHAADIARRVAGMVRRGRILEVACGTGISTQHLPADFGPPPLRVPLRETAFTGHAPG